MRKYIYTRFEKRNVKLVYGTPAVFVIKYPKERQTAKKAPPIPQHIHFLSCITLLKAAF